MKMKEENKPTRSNDHNTRDKVQMTTAVVKKMNRN